MEAEAIGFGAQEISMLETCDICGFLLSSLALSPHSLDVWAQAPLEMMSLLSVCQYPSCTPSWNIWAMRA